jgi:hypothetical protein
MLAFTVPRSQGVDHELLAAIINMCVWMQLELAKAQRRSSPEKMDYRSGWYLSE